MSDTPAPLRILRGDATSPQAAGPKIITHVCNDRGGWGKGFVLALSRRWPEPERDYRAWHRGRSGNDFALGAVRLIRVRPDVHVRDRPPEEVGFQVSGERVRCSAISGYLVPHASRPSGT
jgi:hypothetical protein